MVVKLSPYCGTNYKEFKQKLSDNPLKLSMVFKDTAVDHTNFKDPINYILNTYDIWIDPNYEQTVEYLISNREFNTDDNYFYRDSRTKDIILLEDIRSSYIPKQNQSILSIEDIIFASLKFNLSPVKHLIKRSYQKLPDIIATILGFLTSIDVVFTFI
jgi:hypothetical protein